MQNIFQMKKQNLSQIPTLVFFLPKQKIYQTDKENGIKLKKKKKQEQKKK